MLEEPMGDGQGIKEMASGGWRGYCNIRVYDRRTRSEFCQNLPLGPRRIQCSSQEAPWTEGYYIHWDNRLYHDHHVSPAGHGLAESFLRIPCPLFHFDNASYRRTRNWAPQRNEAES